MSTCMWKRHNDSSLVCYLLQMNRYPRRHPTVVHSIAASANQFMETGTKVYSCTNPFPLFSDNPSASRSAVLRNLPRGPVMHRVREDLIINALVRNDKVMPEIRAKENWFLRRRSRNYDWFQPNPFQVVIPVRGELIEAA